MAAPFECPWAEYGANMFQEFFSGAPFVLCDDVIQIVLGIHCFIFAGVESRDVLYPPLSILFSSFLLA
jgi:hypothetical protein